jgi:hypothetical protein
LTLADLLNIIFRRRRIIAVVTLVGLVAGLAYSFLTKPLYRATAQVRPGIVAYSDVGGPVREGTLKDTEYWFNNRFYWEDMKALPEYASYKAAPLIDAEFIPAGLQFVEGGTVVTLTTLARDPRRGLTILEDAIESFNHQVSIDTVGSTLHLTRKGVLVLQDKLRSDIAQVEADIERTKLEIAQYKRELDVLDADEERLRLELVGIENLQHLREDLIAGIDKDVADARRRLADAEQMLALVMTQERASAEFDGQSIDQVDPVSEVLLQTVRREQAGRAADLLETISGLESRIFTGTAQIDSLRYKLKTLALSTEKLKLRREVDLMKQKADIQQKIDDLQLKLTFDLPYQQAQLEADLAGQQVRYEMISPLERIGRIIVTDKPVRPRKLRATVALTLLAFFGSFVLAFAWEYYERNRRVITASQSR